MTKSSNVARLPIEKDAPSAREAETRVEPPASPPPEARSEAPATEIDLVPGEETRGRRRRGFLRSFLMLFGIAAVVVGGCAYWLHGGRWVSTDDSYLRAPLLMVSTDVSGIVSSVNVAEGQRVKTGDILFRVDDAQFKIALASAQAQLENVRINLTAAHSDYAQLQSGVAAQQAQVALAQVNNDRAASLARTDAGSKATYDQTRFTLDAARNQLEALRRQSEAALARLGGDAAAPIENHPQYLAAKAAVAEAQRQFDHTIVRAPFDGIVTQVDKLQPGTFLVSQTAALTNTGAVALVADQGIYVEANVKETDLTYIKVGDPIEIQVDAYPDRTWTGVVDSISPASGSEFALIPSQNASGNWVKVVQRLPLRLKINQSPNDPQLRAGMSVIANIDTGHMRQIGDLWPSWLPSWKTSHVVKP